MVFGAFIRVDRWGHATDCSIVRCGRMTICLHKHVVPKLFLFLTAMEEIHNSPLVRLGVVSVCLFMALFSETIRLSLECGAFMAGLALWTFRATQRGPSCRFE